jgi:hypothetical protein
MARGGWQNEYNWLCWVEAFVCLLFFLPSDPMRPVTRWGQLPELFMDVEALRFIKIMARQRAKKSFSRYLAVQKTTRGQRKWLY